MRREDSDSVWIQPQPINQSSSYFRNQRRHMIKITISHIM